MSKEREVERGSLGIGPHWFGIEPKSREHWQLLDRLAKAAVAMGLTAEDFEFWQVKEKGEDEVRPKGAWLPVMSGYGNPRMIKARGDDRKRKFNMLALMGMWPAGLKEKIDEED